MKNGRDKIPPYKEEKLCANFPSIWDFMMRTAFSFMNGKALRMGPSMLCLKGRAMATAMLGICFKLSLGVLCVAIFYIAFFNLI